jgi:hypothetical protein
LSWRHNAVRPPAGDLIATVKRLDPNSPLQHGFVVAFGRKMVDDPGSLSRVLFGAGLIDDNTFQLFLLEETAGTLFQRIPFWAKVPPLAIDDNGERLQVSELIPVDIDELDTTGKVAAAHELPLDADGFRACTGAALVFNADLFLSRFKGRRLQFELKCDFMFEVEGEAGRRPVDVVDGNFLLGRLPTGDRIPGGIFWSWVRL